jgi:phage baseplate assembly protein W
MQKVQTEFESASGTLESQLKEQLELLIATPVGTVMLDRDFGIDRSFLDMPIPIAQTMLAAELAVKIPRYIQSLELVEVKLSTADVNGTMRVKVVVSNVE